jgi:cellulose synthase/poly-beta-1,6-N-acetylglucosamine synthase-like glycosyltransferase
MARAFQSDLNLVAATGSIQVLPAEPNDPPWKAIWAECEAVEYLTAFGIGRQYQAATNSLFTLAGAFSAFRREAILDTFLYDQSTVSEDTKMTLDIRKSLASREKYIGCVADAISYVTPTLSFSQLYAQRVRWQRGQLEVAALHSDLALSKLFQINGLSIPRTLIIDHTLAFPRLIWTFLLPMLHLLGYPLSLVVHATIGLYIFYAFIEALAVGACYLVSDPKVRARLRDCWYIPIFIPAYRFVVFWFRLGGFFNVLNDQAEWRVKDPWQETRDGISHTFDTFRGFYRRLIRSSA